jgi:hypothetical protein
LIMVRKGIFVSVSRGIGEKEKTRPLIVCTTS